MSLYDERRKRFVTAKRLTVDELIAVLQQGKDEGHWVGDDMVDIETAGTLLPMEGVDVFRMSEHHQRHVTLHGLRQPTSPPLRRSDDPRKVKVPVMYGQEYFDRRYLKGPDA